MRSMLFSRSSRVLFCLTLLLGAMVLRLQVAPAVDPIADPPDGPVQTEAPQTEPAPSTSVENRSAGPLFTPSEADRISIRGSCSYTVDKQALLLAPLPFAIPDRPRVLIVHTHTTEAYTPTPEAEYTPTGAYHTLDESRNLLAVGDALEDALEALGIGALHLRTVHDYPDYNASYANAKRTIEQALAENPDIVLVLDLHRDAMDEPVREAVTLQDADCARLMLVVGTDEGGLYHPFWQDNLSVALKLQALLGRTDPELCRPLNLRKERFNGQTSPGALLIEVGSTGNTLEEAKRSMPYLAEAIKILLTANH